MTVAVRTTVELLRFAPQSEKTGYLFAALLAGAQAAGVELVDTPTYRGGSDLLMLWGPGAENRRRVMEQHQAAGGHAIVWDAAYWHREKKFRVSIDAAHPQRWIMRRDWPLDRFLADRVPVSNQWHPTGPIVVAGIGRKARAQYGDPVATWEAEMIAACQARWDRPVWYRPKPFTPAVKAPAGCSLAVAWPIERVLEGASLVITWHSNVAIDAIRMGIPVVCQDGAAAAVCQSALGAEDPRPLDPARRDTFLSNLAWFQWGTAHEEALGCWRFLQELLS